MYDRDLALIHDSGFGDYPTKSAPAILKMLAKVVTPGELVVELGCGSGLICRRLVKAGYGAYGLDISPAMIQIARRKAPGARFAVGSAYDAKIPKCAAVISVGECLNYISGGGNHRRDLMALFSRVHRSLKPGGLFIFDLATPGQVPPGLAVTVFAEGPDWFILAAKQENPKSGVLTRRIITFVKTGAAYRRSEEIHLQALYPSTETAEQLRRIGFSVRTSRKYGEFQLPTKRVAFVARKHP